MIVTDGELLGLSVISGGGQLPGIPVVTDGVVEARTALDGLRAKEVVDGQGHVTRFGMVPVRAVEDYRSADRHLSVNQVRVSVNGDGAMTVLCPAPGGWGLFRMSPVEVMVVLVKVFPELRAGGGDAQAGPWQSMSMVDWGQVVLLRIHLWWCGLRLCHSSRHRWLPMI